MVKRVSEDAIAAYWVTAGMDQCRVGFLPRPYIPFAYKYDRVLAQVIKIYDEDDEDDNKKEQSVSNLGCCRAILLTALDMIKKSAKKQK
jgi:DNA-directed RNA polymerase subunit N (RpoN/RPB10)